MPQPPAPLAGTSRVFALLGVGLLIQLAGCFVVYENFPDWVVAEVRFDVLVEPGDDAAAGDADLLFLGILGFGLGSVLSLTAVIALGVLIALRIRDRDTAPTP